MRRKTSDEISGTKSTRFRRTSTIATPMRCTSTSTRCATVLMITSRSPDTTSCTVRLANSARSASFTVCEMRASAAIGSRTEP
jgi:hypothetical protein